MIHKIKRPFCFAAIFLLSFSVMACATRSESKETAADYKKSENSRTKIFEGENFSATVAETQTAQETERAAETTAIQESAITGNSAC